MHFKHVYLTSIAHLRHGRHQWLSWRFTSLWRSSSVNLQCTSLIRSEEHKKHAKRNDMHFHCLLKIMRTFEAICNSSWTVTSLTVSTCNYLLKNIQSSSTAISCTVLKFTIFQVELSSYQVTETNRRLSIGEHCQTNPSERGPSSWRHFEKSQKVPSLHNRNVQ